MSLVYIIDDDPVLQKIVTKLIFTFNASVKVECFDDGIHAFNHIKSSSNIPDLIFLDINMPIMDAWSFLEEYQKLEINQMVPIYILSSSIDSRDISKANAVGLISEYIIKPVAKEKLHEICHKELSLGE